MQFTTLSPGNRVLITNLDAMTGDARKKASRKYNVKGQWKPKQHTTDPSTGNKRATDVSVWEFESAADTTNRSRYRLIRRSKLGSVTWFWAKHTPGNTFEYTTITGYPPIIAAVVPPPAPVAVPPAVVAATPPTGQHQLAAEDSDDDEDSVPESWEDLL